LSLDGGINTTITTSISCTMKDYHWHDNLLIKRNRSSIGESSSQGSQGDETTSRRRIIPPTLHPHQDVNMSFSISSTSWLNNSYNSVISTMLNQPIINEVVDVGTGPSNTTIHLRLSRSTTWSPAATTSIIMCLFYIDEMTLLPLLFHHYVDEIEEDMLLISS